MAAPSPLRWDLFCRVIDNHGDIGVCWRLARQLARGGDAVRLVVDDASALGWMAPGGEPSVRVEAWPGRDGPIGDIVIEAFGCELPPDTMERVRAERPPWIDLEYLSAEPYVERSHGLPSPQRDGSIRHFFFPGFTTATGGLLREPGLLAERAAFDGAAWLRAIGIERRDGERVVSLFCYRNPPLPALLASLARRPTLLLATPGPAQQQLRASGRPPAGLRVIELPWLTQPDYDRLLWSCDLNFVRGEDSLVRAIWAGAPFVWQAYPQQDDAHIAKVEAILEAARLPPAAATAWRAWNGFAPWPGIEPDADWANAALRWRAALAAMPDLAARLGAFARARGAGANTSPG